MWGVVIYDVPLLFHFSVINNATSSLTKTAVTVTIIFIITLGPGECYYALGYTGAVEYKFFSPVYMIGT